MTQVQIGDLWQADRNPNGVKASIQISVVGINRGIVTGFIKKIDPGYTTQQRSGVGDTWTVNLETLENRDRWYQVITHSDCAICQKLTSLRDRLL